MVLNTRSAVFGHFSRMDLFIFHEHDLYFFRNGATQSRLNAQWEAAAHMNKLPHNLLQRMSESELPGDDFGYLEGDW